MAAILRSKLLQELASKVFREGYCTEEDIIYYRGKGTGYKIKTYSAPTEYAVYLMDQVQRKVKGEKPSGTVAPCKSICYAELPATVTSIVVRGLHPGAAASSYPLCRGL